MNVFFLFFLLLFGFDSCAVFEGETFGGAVLTSVSISSDSSETKTVYRFPAATFTQAPVTLSGGTSFWRFPIIAFSAPPTSSVAFLDFLREDFERVNQQHFGFERHSVSSAFICFFNALSKNIETLDDLTAWSYTLSAVRDYFPEMKIFPAILFENLFHTNVRFAMEHLLNGNGVEVRDISPHNMKFLYAFLNLARVYNAHGLVSGVVEFPGASESARLKHLDALWGGISPQRRSFLLAVLEKEKNPFFLMTKLFNYQHSFVYDEVVYRQVVDYFLAERRFDMIYDLFCLIDPTPKELREELFKILVDYNQYALLADLALNTPQDGSGLFKERAIFELHQKRQEAWLNHLSFFVFDGEQDSWQADVVDLVESIGFIRDKLKEEGFLGPKKSSFKRNAPKIS